jgi:hypothetical protein
MSQLELSKQTEIPISTLQYIENEEEKTKATSARTLERIQAVLEDGGIRFLPPRERGSLHGVGVRIWLKKDED